QFVRRGQWRLLVSIECHPPRQRQLGSTLAGGFRIFSSSSASRHAALLSGGLANTTCEIGSPGSRASTNICEQAAPFRSSYRECDLVSHMTTRRSFPCHRCAWSWFCRAFRPRLLPSLCRVAVQVLGRLREELNLRELLASRGRY